MSMLGRLSWTQVIIISTSQFSVDLMSSLAREKICVLASVTLPSAQAHKDAFTELLSRVEDTGVTRVIVSGNSADIARLVKNVYELNINMSILALPWDGSVKTMPGSDMAGVEIFQMVQTHYNMPEFMDNHKEWNYEHVSTWGMIKALYGIIKLDQVNVDDATVKTDLKLTHERPVYHVEQFDLQLTNWHTVGMVERGELKWTANRRSQLVMSYVTDGQCYECHCINDISVHGVGWRYDIWVTILIVIASAGVVTCVLMSMFLCLQCGQVLEGSQVTTGILLAMVTLLYVTLLPFCFLPGDLVCAVKELAPGAVYTLVISVMVSRSLLLTTADTDGLPGHASGWLQSVLVLILVCVQVSVLVVTSLQRTSSHAFTNVISKGKNI